MSRQLQALGAVIGWLLLTGAAFAQAPPARTAFLLDQAQKYAIKREGDAQPLQLKVEPIFNWTNPERLEHKGTVYVWLADGKPEVIGSLFTYELRGHLHEKHALHSLSAKPITAKFGDQLVWKPESPGLIWEALEGPQPAASQRQRQSQLRQLARDFQCTLIDPKNGPTELRFLPKPLIEYVSPKTGVVDGAIFAFVIATDPEALLAVRYANGQWQYAFARFHYWELRARHRDRDVWKAPADDQMHNRLDKLTHLGSIYNSFGVGNPKSIEEK